MAARPPEKTEQTAANKNDRRPEIKTYMKLNSLPNKRSPYQGAFTLIEMIGVLAVIAILAALLIPKVFSAIADAKINNTVVGSETIKTAIADHYGKYGRFDAIFGTNTITAATATPYTNYDINVLMAESLLDKPFQTKLGTNWSIVMAACDPVGTTVTAANNSFSLDGIATTNETTGQYVMEAVIYGVPEADALAVSQRLDGPSLSAATASSTTGDINGRVKYAGASGAATTVIIYLTHR
jgi:prepilin-type N-terminal cleavage/methylation domain-containing protein